MKKACKRHRNLKVVLQDFFIELERDYERGELHPGFGDDLHIRKARIGSPKDRVSKSEGYRIVFEVIDPTGNAPVARCLSLYYKPDRAKLTTREILDLLRDAKVQRAHRDPEDDPAPQSPPAGI